MRGGRRVKGESMWGAWARFCVCHGKREGEKMIAGNVMHCNGGL